VPKQSNKSIRAGVLLISVLQYNVYYSIFFIYLMIYVLIHFHRITSHQLYLNYYTLTDSHYKFAMHLLREMLMHFDCCSN